MKAKLKPETKKAVSDLTDLAALIEDARKELAGDVLATRPAGGFTAKEFSENGKMPLATAIGILNRGVRSGKCEVFSAYHKTSDSRITPHKFYRMVKNAKGG